MTRTQIVAVRRKTRAKCVYTSSKLFIIIKFVIHILPPQVSQSEYSTRHRADCILIQIQIIIPQVLVDLEVSQFPGMKYVLDGSAVTIVFSLAEQIMKRILKDWNVSTRLKDFKRKANLA